MPVIPACRRLTEEHGEFMVSLGYGQDPAKRKQWGGRVGEGRRGREEEEKEKGGKGWKEEEGEGKLTPQVRRAQRAELATWLLSLARFH